MIDEDRERYRQLGETDGNACCVDCGAFLPNEYHDDDCPFVLKMEAQK